MLAPYPNPMWIFAYHLLAVLTAIPGLWVAAHWLPQTDEWFERIGAGSLVANRGGRLMVWVALGILFASPLLDLLSVLNDLARLWLSADIYAMMSTVWGAGSYDAYAKFTILTTLVIYGTVLWSGVKLTRARSGAEMGVRSLSLPQWFVLFAVASLVSRFMRDIVFRSIWFPVGPVSPFSYVGYTGAWVAGLALLVAGIIWVLILLSQDRPVTRAASSQR